MKNIIFRRLYTKITDLDYGQARYAIITFEKIVIAHRIKKLTEEEALKSGHNVQAIATIHKYFLQIDLWLIILRFQWKF